MESWDLLTGLSGGPIENAEVVVNMSGAVSHLLTDWFGNYFVFLPSTASADVRVFKMHYARATKTFTPQDSGNIALFRNISALWRLELSWELAGDLD